MKIDRQKIHDKFNGHCAYCGCEITVKDMQVDHVIPKGSIYTFSKGVPLSELERIENLFPSCRICNKWKSDNSLEYFRNEIFEQIKRLNDYSTNFRMAKKYGLVAETPHPILFYFETY